MNAETLKKVLRIAFQTGDQLLIVGPPGCGKSEIVTEVANELNYQLAVFHPAVEEPTDVKGFPWCYEVEGKPKAEFITYGEMARLLQPKTRMVAFIDDLGHAHEDMQAAWMQPLWARSLNGHPISPNVVFVAATNDIKDKAGVHGLIEPLKSRFSSIIRYMPTVEDWTAWAYKHNMPNELIAFVRFRPELLFKFDPTKEIKNSPCPRTIAALGRLMQSQYPEEAFFELAEGAVGSGFATEFIAYRKIYREMPDLQQILEKPDEAPIPTEPGVLYAVCTGLAKYGADLKKAPNIVRYATRLGKAGKSEFEFMLMKDLRTVQPKMMTVKEYTKWLVEKEQILSAMTSN